MNCMIQNLSTIKCTLIRVKEVFLLDYAQNPYHITIKLDAFSVLSSKEVICVFIVIVVKEEEVL